MTPRRGRWAIPRRTCPRARRRWGKEELGKDEEEQGSTKAKEQDSVEEDEPWWH